MEGDHVGPTGVLPGQLERALNRLGARVGEERARRAHARGRANGEPLAQLDVRRDVPVARAVVEERVTLALDGLDDTRMAVAGARNRDACVEVEESVAVDVLDHEPVAARGHERVHAAERRARHRGVARDPCPRLRAGQLGDQVRCDRLGEAVAAIAVGKRDHGHEVTFLAGSASADSSSEAGRDGRAHAAVGARGCSRPRRARARTAR